LKSALAGTIALGFPSLLRAQAANGGVNRLSDKIAILDGGGPNVVAFSASEGVVLVDSGAPKNGDKLLAALKTFASNAKVNTLFNTHYHLDQTGNNEVDVHGLLGPFRRPFREGSAQGRAPY
jgi:glyoxylase-like metal-dependent hydrolase (beta-lactamase superfamily II)